MPDLEPGVQLTDSTAAAMERLRALPAMAEQHKATPEQWALLEEMSSPEYVSTILELRDRVKELENGQQEQSESNLFCIDAIVRRVEALEDYKLRHSNAHSKLAKVAREASSRLSKYDVKSEQTPSGPLRCPGAHIIAECGGPCESEGFQSCNCGLLEKLNRGRSLVERVGLVITPASQTLNREWSSAAILEVAAWLRERGNHGSASELEQEAER